MLLFNLSELAYMIYVKTRSRYIDRSAEKNWVRKKMHRISLCLPRRSVASDVVQSDEVVDGHALPDLRLTGTRITRSLVQSVESELPWKPAIFHVCDTLGGPQREAIVEYAEIDTDIYIKTVDPLRKREFEEIFFFSCGEFSAGRVIRAHASQFSIS